MDKRLIGLGTVSITEDDISAVTNVLRSGRISPGKIQKTFETVIANEHGYTYGTFVNSGQSALHLAFEAIKLLDSNIDTVVSPAVTYISTLHAAWNAGLKVKLIDVELETLNMKGYTGSPNEILCPVDLMGLSGNPDGRFNGSWIVEDNCESIFAPHTGYGHFMCNSFYTAHTLTTGSGGMVCTNGLALDNLIKSLCNHGRTNPGVLYTADRNVNFDRTKDFVFDKIAFSFKASDMNAALGLSQFKRKDKIVQAHIDNAKYLIERLKEYVNFPPIKDNTFMNLPIIAREPKFALVDFLNDYQIETRSLMPIINQPIVEKMLPDYYMNKEQFPNAHYLLDRGFYIGCHEDLTFDDLNYIIDVFDLYYS